MTRSIGHDHIDISECEKRSIVVCFVPSYGDNTVAQHTFALILALSRRTPTAFEMEIVASDIHRQSNLEEVLGFRYVSLDQLLGCSHIISLHAPLTPATFHLLNSEKFSKCRPGVLIINTARGRLIDTDALIEGARSRDSGWSRAGCYRGRTRHG